MALHVLLAVALLGVAVYAQYPIPFHTAGRGSVVLTRTALLLTGVLAGAVAAILAPDRSAAIVAFVQGFGVVHVPAAVILMLKRARQDDSLKHSDRLRSK
jgi:hypothetical protein